MQLKGKPLKWKLEFHSINTMLGLRKSDQLAKRNSIELIKGQGDWQSERK